MKRHRDERGARNTGTGTRLVVYMCTSTRTQKQNVRSYGKKQSAVVSQRGTLLLAVGAATAPFKGVGGGPVSGRGCLHPRPALAYRYGLYQKEDE